MNLLIYSAVIVSILLAVTVLWFIFVPIFGGKPGSSLSPVIPWITFFLLIASTILMIITIILVQPEKIDKTDASGILLKSNNVVVSPFITSTISEPSNQNFVYYQFLPKEKIMKKLNLDNLTAGKKIIDYFHRNDESIFVLSDGTVISIIGDKITTEKSVPPIEKIRVLGKNYIGLSNGKLFISRDLKDWTLDSTKPSNVIDFDVPTKQSNYLFVQTPTDNLILDTTKNNRIVSREKSDTLKFGSTLDKYVKIDNQGVWINGKTLLKNYKIADIDQNDHVYAVPSETREFTATNIMTADDYALMELQSDPNLSERIFVGDQIIYQ
jgi:hypothetical protein